jgi:hypothetical protein
MYSNRFLELGRHCGGLVSAALDTLMFQTVIKKEKS